jgi:hypothetical protein
VTRIATAVATRKIVTVARTRAADDRLAPAPARTKSPMNRAVKMATTRSPAVNENPIARMR